MREPSAPRVAVIVPCYDDGVVLQDALGSLEGQEPHELVVVDDGSTGPETLRILDAVEARGVRVVHQDNAGLSAARMRGVVETTAPYIHTLDSDDMLAPGALRVLADALDASPAAALSWGDYRTFGAQTCTFPMSPTLDPWRITYISEIPANSMTRRTSLTSVAGWELTRGCEDWDLWMKFAERGMGGAHVPQVTLLYRVHEAPRMYTEAMARHDERRACLARRHAPLYRARRPNRRRSPSPRALKVLFPAIDAIPRVSELRKAQLYAAARRLFQPEASSDCFPGLGGMLLRVARALRSRLGALSPSRVLGRSSG